MPPKKRLTVTPEVILGGFSSEGCTLKRSCRNRHRTPDAFHSITGMIGLLDPHLPQHMPTQRCPRLTEALLNRLPAPDRPVGDHVPHARLGVEQNPLQEDRKSTRLNSSHVRI